MLRQALPTKREYVLLIRMSPIQRKLYKCFMESLEADALMNGAGENNNNPLKAFSVCCKVRRDLKGIIVQSGKSSVNLSLGPSNLFVRV